MIRFLILWYFIGTLITFIGVLYCVIYSENKVTDEELDSIFDICLERVFNAKYILSIQNRVLQVAAAIIMLLLVPILDMAAVYYIIKEIDCSYSRKNEEPA